MEVEFIPSVGSTLLNRSIMCTSQVEEGWGRRERKEKERGGARAGRTCSFICKSTVSGRRNRNASFLCERRQDSRATNQPSETSLV